MCRGGMTSQILLGITLGVSLGLGLKHFTKQPWSERDLMYLQFPGELFLISVNCLILPLVASSIIASSCSIGQSGKFNLLVKFLMINLNFAICWYSNTNVQAKLAWEHCIITWLQLHSEFLWVFCCPNSLDQEDGACSMKIWTKIIESKSPKFGSIF